MGRKNELKYVMNLVKVGPIADFDSAMGRKYEEKQAEMVAMVVCARWKVGPKIVYRVVWGEILMQIKTLELCVKILVE